VEKWTLGYGGMLTALGVGGFVATGAEHKTALIPAGVGVVALGLGALARHEGARRVALGAAALVGVLGVAGGARGLGKLPALLSGEEVARPAAVVEQSAMAGLSAVYLGLCVAKLLRK